MPKLTRTRRNFLRMKQLQALLRANAITPFVVDGDEYYGLRLPESRLQEAYDAGLAPFSLIDGSPWIESMLPTRA